MATKKTWTEFRSTGLLLFINQILHAFGWSIVFEIGDDGEIKTVYPARVKFRGFDEKSVSEEYAKIGKYLKDNSEEMFYETNENET